MNLNKDKLIKQLLTLFPPELKLERGNLNKSVFETLVQCFNSCIKSLSKITNIDVELFKITSVLDYLYEQLNTGHWSEVPLNFRYNYTIARFIKTLLLLQEASTVDKIVLGKCIKCLDMGLLLGAPLNENPELLAEVVRILRLQSNSLEVTEKEDKIATQLTDNLKRKSDNDQDNTARKKFCEISAEEIEELEVPSIETFMEKYFKPQTPVKLTKCMSHWPAVTKWLDVNYLLNIAGQRTVPVEIGSSYADSNWSQKLMTLKDYIKRYYLSDGENIGYMAQHNLFDQIIELKEDIRIPEYCCCSLNYDKLTDPDINAWFGPSGTISPLHQDPKNNILAQVYGTKQLILFSPNDTDYLYPYDDKLLSNTSRLDPLQPDLMQYPEFQHTKMYKCLLKPGEMLFIPIKWWHHVTALEKSFSVSFWWE